jgi:hypothetical protein
LWEYTSISLLRKANQYAGDRLFGGGIAEGTKDFFIPQYLKLTSQFPG